MDNQINATITAY